MKPIYVAGVGMTQFGKHPEKAVWNLAAEALDAVLKDASAEKSHIQSIFYSGQTQGALQGQFAIPGQVVMARLGLGGVAVHNIENACASGTTAFQLAVQALRAGECDIALALGAEKMNISDKLKSIALFDGGWDVSLAKESADRLLALGRDVPVPEGSESDRPYSRFMAIYASLCKFWMKELGTTQRQIAAVSAKNHHHSVHNENAQYRKSFTVDEVLAAPPITYPLTMPMCSPISDGGAAVIVCTEAGLKKLDGSRKRAVKVASTALTSATDRGPLEFEKAACRRAANIAYERAGLGPEDIDVVEVHDATAMGEIMAVEFLRLTEMGGGGIAAERGDLSIGGRLPVNPSGGLESKGHPIGATGLGQITELITQLRGEAGLRQVENARVALQENGGGQVRYEEAAVAVNIFTK